MNRRNMIHGLFWLFLIIGLATVRAQGPAGYTYCASEGQSFKLLALSHVAYGADGKFSFRYNQTGAITFDNTTFGDPAVHHVKSGYYKVVTGTESPAQISAAIDKLKAHLTGSATLSASDINHQASIIRDKAYLMGANDTIIKKALDLVNYYETKKGPLFINADSKGGFPNQWGATDGYELVRAIFAVQQGVFDEAFTAKTLAKYPALINGEKFATAAFCPGSCAAPANPNTVYSAKINATMPKDWGKPTAFSASSARRPTGYYLAPGSIGSITVPASMVNKGFKILVGALTRDKTSNEPVRRFYRITNTFEITHTTTKIANPFGGGIYIVTPYLADCGIVTVQLANVVPAPFFSAKSFDQTSLADWLTIQRKNPAPWADFESDKFMMQVPTSWIYNYADPVTLMKNWDKCMDGVSEFLGYPLVRNNTVLYVQVDLDIMSGVFGIGYPQINNTYNPNKTENGNKDHWFLHPENFWSTEFHELGHAQMFSKFPGHEEADVNILSCAIWNRKFGMNLDSALAKSRPNSPGISRDQAAMNWMVFPNFRDGKPMDISATTKDEVRYQHRGYAYYADIAALFGWDVIHAFYQQEQLDYIAKKTDHNLNEIDSRILRLSKAAGVDLRPLIHFWGIQPNDAGKLKNLISSAKLSASPLIYDRLIHYKSIIPMNNAEFMTHAKVFCNTQVLTTGEGSPDYGEGWYYVWQNIYNETHGAAAQTALQNIIKLYFPKGRPTNETMPPGPNPASFATLPKPVSPTEITMTATTGSDVNGPVQYLFTETSCNPGATSSLWQTSPTYVDSGLTPNTSYSYTVTLRDAIGNRGNASSPASTTTSTASIKK